MGQARRRARSWGFDVAQPLTYAPVDLVWTAALDEPVATADEDFLAFLKASIRTAARASVTIPSVFDPDRPFETLAPLDFVDEPTMFLETDDTGKGFLVWDRDLAKPSSDLPSRPFRLLLGHLHRMAFLKGDPIEVAIDVAGQRFVTRQGPIEDLEFFRDKAVLVDERVAHHVGDPLTLQVTALVAAASAGGIASCSERAMGAVADHMDLMSRIAAKVHRDELRIQADVAAFEAVRDDPDLILAEGDPRGPYVEFMAIRMLRLYREAHARMSRPDDRSLRSTSA